MQENDVRDAAQGNIAEHAARGRVDGEQYAGIAGAQQPPGGRIEIQSVPGPDTLFTAAGPSDLVEWRKGLVTPRGVHTAERLSEFID